MAGLIGADVDQLRALAKQFTQAADRLQQSSRGLSTVIANAGFWRGNDANQFRTQWRSQSTPSITSAVNTLRSAAEALAHNADEQDQASAAGGGTNSTSGTNSESDESGPAGTAVGIMLGLKKMSDAIKKKGLGSFLKGGAKAGLTGYLGDIAVQQANHDLRLFNEARKITPGGLNGLKQVFWDNPKWMVQHPGETIEVFKDAAYQETVGAAKRAVNEVKKQIIEPVKAVVKGIKKFFGF